MLSSLSNNFRTGRTSALASLVLIAGLCIAVLSYGQAQDNQGTNSGPVRKHTSVTGRSRARRAASGEEESSAAPHAARQSYPPKQVQEGRELFAAQCSFCHGRDARGGETGPDLMASPVVARDVHGEKIGAVVRNGRIDKGMPAFTLDEGQIAAVVAFLHTEKAKTERTGTAGSAGSAAKREGGRRTVDLSDLQSGDPEAGKQYFNGPGGCAKCHSATGDLAGVASRLEGLALLERMLYPGRGRNNPSPTRVATATVTLPSGQTITGPLAYRDEFTIALIDPAGWYRSWPTGQVKWTVQDPLEAHSEQLGKYTDEDIHNVLAYIQTLR